MICLLLPSFHMHSVNQPKSNDGAEFLSDAVLSQYSDEVGATVRDAVCARLSGDSQSYGQCEEHFEQLAHGTREQFKALVGQCLLTAL
jgi:hypothetical protein